jgi:hypothetical protein
MSIKSSRYRNVYADFEVLCDPKPSVGRDPAVAILVEPKRREKFLMPMSLRAAAELGLMLFQTAATVDPTLFFALLSEAE